MIYSVDCSKVVVRKILSDICSDKDEFCIHSQRLAGLIDGVS